MLKKALKSIKQGLKGLMRLSQHLRNGLLRLSTNKKKPIISERFFRRIRVRHEKYYIFTLTIKSSTFIIYGEPSASPFSNTLIFPPIKASVNKSLI